MDLKELSIEDFVAEIKVGGSYPDHRYTLFLGAGCSKSSGIPTAGELVRDYWIPKMAPSGEDPIEWAGNHIDGFDQENPATWYGAVIEKCFRNPMVRQLEIERICEAVSPGFGYSVVAQLCAQNNTPFSVVLTTNFDDLVADAMFLYTTESRPLVIHHAALAEYIRPTRNRPMVVKLHGDARLSPKNTVLETDTIEKAMREQVKNLLTGRGLLFFGYAGADSGVFQILAELSSNALDLGVYWVNKNLPASQEFREWLEGRNATWVRYTDFDEAMLRFYRAYDLQPPQKDRFDRIFDTWDGQFEKLNRQIDAKPDEDEDKSQLMAEAEAVRSSINAWRSVNTILAMENQDPDAALLAYQAAVREHPGFTPLLNNYAFFLTDVRGDHDAAENCYKRAIEADPNQADILGNYALFLTNVRNDHDAAEDFYKRAIDADPNHANILGNYAFFLTDVRRDHDTAETFYKRAIESDPKYASHLGNYALFLTNVRNDHDAAEDFYKRAIDADPNHANHLGNYANLLTAIRGDHDNAEDFYKRAIQAGPKRANILGNYAIFLTDVRRDYDTAETFFKRGIDASPRHAGILGNYAVFLITVRNDHDAAEDFYKRAIDADPRRASILGNYGELLLYRGEHDQGFDLLSRSDAAARDKSDLKKIVENEICRAIHTTGEDRRTVLSRLHQSLRDIPTPYLSCSHGERTRYLSVAAAEDGQWLAKLIDVSEGKAEIDELNEWPAWQAAGRDEEL